MGQNTMFSSKPNYSEVVDIVTEHVDYLSNGYFTSDVVARGVHDLKHIPSNRQKKFCEFVSYVDRSFATNFKNPNFYHKIPTIVAGSIYFTEYFSQVADLSKEEMSVLAKYSITHNNDFYEDAPDIFSKDVLQVIVSKTPDFFARDSLMFLFHNKLSTAIDKETLALEFENKPLHGLLEESFQKEEKIVEEELQHGSRGF